MAGNRIRVLQITHDLAIGGLQKVVVNICKAINRAEFDPSVLCLRALGPFARDIEALGIRVELLPQKADGTDYFSFLKVAAVLRRERPDVIHTHNTQPFLDGTLASVLAGVGAIVHTDHGRQFPDKRRYMWAERLASRRAYRVVGVSDTTSSLLALWERIRPPKLTTVPNGVECGARLTPAGLSEKARQLGVDGTHPLLGVVARLSREKGVEFSIRAMPAVARRWPQAMLLVVGEGPLEAELRALVADLGLGAHVRFLGARADVAEILGMLDAFVLPSLSEGLPMVILEALAAGCPIVATGVGGVPSLLRHGTTGLVVAPADSDQLAEAMCTLAGDRRRRASFAKAGREFVGTGYSVDAMVRHYEQLYREASEERARCL
jgi:glycosyltransferase involved in cell wall biosynthesis